MLVAIPGKHAPNAFWKDGPQKMPEQLISSNRSTIRFVVSALVILVLLSITLSWVSSAFQAVGGWAFFLGVLLLATAVLWLGWRLIRAESPPRWLARLLLGAALLRLAMGAIWFIALPLWGHESPTEQAGYVMADAHERDQSAWELSQSEKPLTRAFQGRYQKFDQYGGLLFLSAFLYRYLGGEIHSPLQIVVITAAISALGVLFVWAYSRRSWDDGVAHLAAWGFALYPEAVLIGSSQMREAFTMTLTIAAFYGLVRYWRDRSRVSLALILGALVLTAPLSPPAAGILVVMLVLQAVFIGRPLLQGQLTQNRRLWLILGGLVFLILIGIWMSWSRFAPEGVTNPIALIGWWVRKSAQWQAHLSERASGWVQRIFDSTPEWTHYPLLLAYGVVQPFLPAALIDITSVRIWRWIAIWRAMGWALLLPFLLYAPLRAWSKKGDRISRGLSVVVWSSILMASFRGGADMWDNPRYRVMFVGLQIALASWAIYKQRRDPDPLFKHVILGVLIILAWFVPWYLWRYIHLPWPIEEPFKVLGLGLVSVAFYGIWAWMGSRRKDG
jgi:hypothetical protein